MQLKNDLLLRAARGEETERTPVWLMRQAGRILPEYRAVRASLSGFKELVETPERAAEVTIQPVDLLGVDAAIIFSDILVIPEAMGLPYELVEKVGPRFPEVINSRNDLNRLHLVEPEEHLGYVLDAIKITKKELDGRVPLIGFAGAPWTILCYMIEGKGTKAWAKARRLLWEDEVLARTLLEQITEATIVYLKAQVAAGADLVQVFDSWAGVLSKELYNKFAMLYMKRICDAITEVPVTVFAKGGGHFFEDLATLNCETLGLDWNIAPERAREIVGDTKTLQGNLDPSTLYGTHDQVIEHTKEMLRRFGGRRHIANLGHGVYPDIDPERVRTFIQTIKEY
ncbi:MAG: uroporphyrinogen decarboxylase [Flavobacteriales bacterium]|nr:uroporphyrinogen decarboxylase [Flavobacteriales bacterium]